MVSFVEKPGAAGLEAPCDSSPSLPQVDLRFLTVLTAIATQGAISRETQNGYYVKSYKLEVSTNGEDWMVYRHGKNHKVNGNRAGNMGEEDPTPGRWPCLVGQGVRCSGNLSYAKVIATPFSLPAWLQLLLAQQREIAKVLSDCK